jgi:hypothetical protein
MNNNYYKPGSWNAICDSCGFKFKAEELRLRWDGLRVCSNDFETRHPQDLLRVPREDISVPWSRPEVVESYVDFALVTETGVQFVTEDATVINYLS